MHFNIPKEKKATEKSCMVLAGDVGATKTNLALMRAEGDHQAIYKEAQYKSQQYKSFNEMADHFLDDLPLPESVCIGVAGPVMNNKAKLTNLLWEIDGNEIAGQMGVEKVELLNDLEATAYGLVMLKQKDIKVIHAGAHAAVGNAALIAHGTGLGEAGLFWDGNYYHPFATEGGHTDFAARTDFDFELFTYLQKKFDHVSWERVVSGPGIASIYQFLRDVKNSEEPGWLKDKFNNGDMAAVISQQAAQSEICKETMQHFIRYLAAESANLVLKFKATGGLYIGGGIAPQIVSLLNNHSFVASFCNSGRLNYLLEMVPIKIILNPKTALLGAAYYGARNFVPKTQITS
jgi:glucokinase